MPEREERVGERGRARALKLKERGEFDGVKAGNDDIVMCQIGMKGLER